jgi:hypothetical protein
MASYKNQDSAHRYWNAAVAAFGVMMLTNATVLTIKSIQYSHFQPKYSNDSPPLTFNNALEGTKVIFSSFASELTSFGAGTFASLGMGAAAFGANTRRPRE